MIPTQPTGAPVDERSRVASLDVLRGFAVLGILVMNIQSFAMVGAGYNNPTAYGDLTGANYWVWALIATAIFYGHGLGLFGRVERVGQILIVAAIWAVRLAVSPFWLRRHRFGPLELLWRSLVYGRRQPIRARPLSRGAGSDTR